MDLRSHDRLAGSDCGSCGNGAVDGNELCDGTAFEAGADTCADYGYVGGTLSCSADCTPVFTACLDHECGNGILETGEACDGTSFGDATCASKGFYGGMLACTSSCTLDTSGCVPSGTANYDGFYEAFCGFFVRCASTLGPEVPDLASCEAALPADFTGCTGGVPPASQAAVDDCASFHLHGVRLGGH